MLMAFTVNIDVFMVTLKSNNLLHDIYYGHETKS